MKESDFLKFIHKISHRTGFKGVGDDAAVIDSSQKSPLVITTDQFIEGTHFTWQQMSAKDVGYKGVVQALSDLAAMAAQPFALLCSAAWPQKDQPKIKQAFLGIQKACKEYSIPLVGGDISRSSKTYFDFCAMGTSLKPALKSGAKPGDLIALSGCTGPASAGLLCTDKKWSYKPLIQKFKSPQAHIPLALQLGASGYLTSLTDTSDSLSQSLQDISSSSECDVIIEKQKLPIYKPLEKFCSDKKLNIYDFILNGGEDYQLAMTLKKSCPASFILDHSLTVIGYATESKMKRHKIFLQEKNQIKELIAKGWDPFS